MNFQTDTPEFLSCKARGLKYHALAGRKRLLKAVSGEIEAMATRLGWQVQRAQKSKRTGTCYLRLRLPEVGHACIRISDHAKPAGSVPELFDWILSEHWGQPLTDLREWLWQQARENLDRPPVAYRPRWLPKRRFDVKAYLAERERARAEPADLEAVGV